MLGVVRGRLTIAQSFISKKASVLRNEKKNNPLLENGLFLVSKKPSVLRNVFWKEQSVVRKRTILN